MKKVISILLAMMMLLSIGAVCTSAYTLPEGYALSADEGAAFDSVEGQVIGYVGDADESNDVSIKDATAIQKHVAELVTIEGNALLLADVDFSNDISIKDATSIQKWIAKIAIDEPVFHLLYKGEAVATLSIVGTWTTTADMADVINAEIAASGDPLMAEHVNIETFMAKVIYTFNEDGTITTVYDKAVLDESVVKVKKELAGDMKNYLEAIAKNNGLNMTADQMLALMGYKSMTEFVDEILSEETVNQMAAPTSGTYKIEGDKLYTAADGEEFTNFYEVFTLTDDTLTLTSCSDANYQHLYPVVFDRV
ncbi:MAG: dockerin type I repeat-containing protein [Ruminococcus sp.]|nr:dockerin type I repeat-containing protein [Ruminococcus sp.]